MKSVGEIASEIWPVFFLFFTHFGEIWPWPVPLALGQGHRHLGCWMRLIGLYLGTKHEVCRWNSIWSMAHFIDVGQFFDIWPWPLVRPKVKVIGTWIIKCALLGCILVLSMKSVGQIGFEIWTQVWLTSCLTLKFDLESSSTKNIYSINVFNHHTK